MKTKNGAQTLKTAFGFHGSHEITMDRQGRLALPSAFRNAGPALQSVLMAYFPDEPESLIMVPQPLFAELLADDSVSLRPLTPLMNPVTIDNGFRVTLPPLVRKQMFVEGEKHPFVINGMGQYFSAWRREDWLNRREHKTAEAALAGMSLIPKKTSAPDREQTTGNTFCFFGTYPVQPDSKDRVSIPAIFRHNAPTADFLLIQDPEKPVLVALPGNMKVHMPQQDVAALSPFSEMVSPNTGSRMTLTADFEYAALGGSRGALPPLMMVGRGSYFEIWPRDEWKREEQAEESAAKNSARALLQALRHMGTAPQASM